MSGSFEGLLEKLDESVKNLESLRDLVKYFADQEQKELVKPKKVRAKKVEKEVQEVLEEVKSESESEHHLEVQIPAVKKEKKPRVSKKIVHVDV